MYAVVDIETSGSHTTYDRIIEIAIFVTDGRKIINQYHSLVNPEVEIPYWISGLTGIENSDLYDAPKFSQIFDNVNRLLEGKIFVAHNVNFDFGFIKSEYEREGVAFDAPKLCTVRLARKVFPGFRSYSLGSICSSLGITIEKRHRADGDAKATVKLLHRIIAADQDGEIPKALKKNSKEQTLPPNLPKSTYDNLPDSTGIYFLHNDKGKVIYVGKADNIKKRITGHFTSGSSSRQNQSLFNNIFDITYENCGNELIALIREIEEIKKLWPEHNKESKKPVSSYGVYIYEDQAGMQRVCSGKLSPDKKPVMVASSALKAREIIRQKAVEFNLCERLCNLRKDNCTACKGDCLPANRDEYNSRVYKAFSPEETGKRIIFKGKGRNNEEIGFVMMKNNCLEGFGYVPAEVKINSGEELEPYIRRVKDNPDIHRVLSGYIKKVRKSDYVIRTEKDSNYIQL
jgi:DNA polymerase III subunit epsilon